MEQYIPKSVLLAEIEKIIGNEEESIKCFERSKNASEVQRSNARIGVLTHIRSLLDTLEVKEVDLEKEIDTWYQNKASKEFENVFYQDIEDCAKYFFELGLKAHIETPEVKEIDLEKEYKDFIKCDNGRSMFETAKHFFELGLNVRRLVNKYSN